MRRPASGVLPTRHIRRLLAIVCAVFCFLVSGADVRSRLLAQPGVRARKKVIIRPVGKNRKQDGKDAVKRRVVAPVSLWVVTKPPGCRVTVDDQDLGETNAAGEMEVKLLPGAYYVRVSRTGYITMEAEIEVADTTEVQEAEFTLPLALTTLNVVTEPPETEIYLDNVYKGASDPNGLLVIERVNPNQPHTLRAAKEGYQQQTMPLTSYSGQIVVKLFPSAVRLKVLTEPPEAEVYLDGVYKGTSSEGVLLIEQVNPNQSHTVRAARSGYTQQSVTLPPGKHEITVRLSPDPVVLLARSLSQNVAQGRLTEAFPEYERLAAEAPDHQELPRLLEAILQSLKARTAAALRQVGPYGLDADLDDVQELSGLYERARGRRAGDETLDYFSRYWAFKELMLRADRSPSSPEREGLRQKARALLAELGRRPTDSAQLLLDLGWAWWKLDDKPAALKHLLRAQELRPDWAYAHFALGVIAMREAELEVSKSPKALKYGQAIASFNKAIEAKPDFARAYALHSLSNAVMRRYEEAIASGRRAAALEPQSAYAHFALGFAYFQRGKPGYVNALSAYERALALGGSELDAATRASIQRQLAVIRKALK